MSRTSLQKKESIGILKRDTKKSKISKSVASTFSIAAVDTEDEATKRASSLAYVIISKEDSEELLHMSAIEMESKLESRFELNPMTNLKDASILDYYVGAMYWAKEHGFDGLKLSGFFTVIHNLLNKIKEENISFVDCMKEFCRLMVGIAVELGPELDSGGLEFFSVEEAKAVSEYMNNTLFKHYKLYTFMFHYIQEEEIISSDLSVEVPLPATAPFPPPLDEGISEEVVTNYLMIPTPALSTEVTADLKLEEEKKPLTPVDVDLPPELADIFSKLTAEDVKTAVEEVTSLMLETFQTGVETKIRQQENNVLAKINKIHNVLPEPTADEEESYS